MKKLLFLGIFAGVLVVAAPVSGGGFLSVNVGLPILGVQIGGGGVHVQAGPVGVGVGISVPFVHASSPVGVRPARVHGPRCVAAPVPFTVYQGPYPSHIAPPFCP